eukprot:scaffold31407_cov39-Attheya_sp.AAC.1
MKPTARLGQRIKFINKYNSRAEFIITTFEHYFTSWPQDTGEQQQPQGASSTGKRVMEAARTPMKNPFVVMEFEGVDGLYKFVYGMDVAIYGVVMEWNKWLMMTNNIWKSRGKFVYGMDVATSGVVMELTSFVFTTQIPFLRKKVCIPRANSNSDNGGALIAER